MKRSFKVLAIGLLIVSLFVTGAFAKGGPPANRPYYNQTTGTTPYYNVVAQETETITGTIQSVALQNWTIKLENGQTVRVGIGPFWYLEQIGLNLKVGDTVTLKGAYVNNYFVPVEVIKDGRTFKLRNENGFPLWAGRRNNSNQKSINAPRGQGHRAGHHHGRR